MRTNTLIINTPEGVVFPLLLAGPVTRFLAWLMDVACVFAVLSALSIAMSFLKFVAGDIAGALFFVAYFVISIGYGIALEWIWRGQTIGKRLFRLRVMDEHGLRLQFSQVVI